MSAREPRIGRLKGPRRPEEAGVRSNSADFSDAQSGRVLAAAADALIGELARQAARDLFADWIATRKGL